MSSRQSGELVSLDQYKIAKLFLERLPDVYRAIDQARMALLPNAVFRPVGDILRCLRDQRKILESHEAKAKKLTAPKENQNHT
jgi:hypothetical protein